MNDHYMSGRQQLPGQTAQRLQTAGLALPEGRKIGPLAPEPRWRAGAFPVIYIYSNEPQMIWPLIKPQIIQTIKTYIIC